MSDLKFACPNCQQHIQCEAGYAGLEIACPACHSKMVVPQPVGAAAPALAQAPGLRVSASAPPPPPPAPMDAAVGGKTCPSCGNPVAPAAIMCIKCGTNLRTGQKMMAPGRPGARPAIAAAAAGPTVWYKTAYPYVGAYFALIALLYFLGGGFRLLCLLGIILYFIAVKIVITVFAFKDDGAGKGFLCLCFDFYTMRYVFNQSGRPLSKVLYASAWALGLMLILMSRVLKD